MLVATSAGSGRGFGGSSQPAYGYDFDTFAADLNTLLAKLDLTDVTLVGHSMGTGEVTRYLGAYGSARVARACWCPRSRRSCCKTDDNPEGLPGSLFDGFVQAAKADGPAWMKGFLDNFYNMDVLGGTLVSDQAFQASWNIATAASATAAVACIPTWETDFRPGDRLTLVLRQRTGARGCRQRRGRPVRSPCPCISTHHPVT